MDNYIEENKQVYDLIADQFSSTRDWLWDDLKPLKQYTRKGDVVLDIGCGNGRLYQMLADLSISYTGIDQSEGMIAEAKKRSPNLNFLVAEMTELPIEDNSVHVIYTVATFHHLSDDRMRIKALEEMKRVLKSGGKIVMTNWNLHNDWVKEKIKEGKFEIDSNDSRHIKIPWRTGDGKIWGWRNYWSFTMDELEELFEKAGFKLAEEQYFTADNTGRTDIEKGMNVVTVAVSGKQSKL